MNKRGLTLMEVIVAALILALTVGGILCIFSSEKGVVARTGRRIQAIEFARQTIEELKNAVSADTWTTTAFVDGSYTDKDLPAGCELKVKFPYQGSSANVMREYKIEPVTGISPADGYKKVSVTVKWDEPQ